MNIKLIKLLGSICTALLLIISAEWLYAKHADAQLQKLIETVETHPYKVDELPGLELTKQPEDKYADLVSRPLFIKGRRPVETADIEEEGAAAAGSDTFDWQLAGIYTKGSQLSALFRRTTDSASGKKYLKITEGNEINGWTLAEIHQDKIMLKQGSHQKELMLRKPKLKESAKPKSGPNGFAPKADMSGNSANE